LLTLRNIEEAARSVGFAHHGGRWPLRRDTRGLRFAGRRQAVSVARCIRSRRIGLPGTRHLRPSSHGYVEVARFWTRHSLLPGCRAWQAGGATRAGSPDYPFPSTSTCGGPGTLVPSEHLFPGTTVFMRLRPNVRIAQTRPDAETTDNTSFNAAGTLSLRHFRWSGAWEARAARRPGNRRMFRFRPTYPSRSETIGSTFVARLAGR